MQVEARTMTEVKQWLVIQGMLKKGPKFIHNSPFAENVAESKLQHLAETFSHSSESTVPLSRPRTQRTSLSDFGESKNKRVGIREREGVCCTCMCTCAWSLTETSTKLVPRHFRYGKIKATAKEAGSDAMLTASYVCTDTTSQVADMPSSSWPDQMGTRLD